MGAVGVGDSTVVLDGHPVRKGGYGRPVQSAVVGYASREGASWGRGSSLKVGREEAMLTTLSLQRCWTSSCALIFLLWEDKTSRPRSAPLGMGSQ